MQNYWEIHAIKTEIERVPRAGHEAILYGAWNAILGWQFDVRNGYFTRPQDKHTSQSGQEGSSDLHTYHYVNNAPKAKKFLLVQCKRPQLYRQNSTWLEEVSQLSRYSAATHGRRRVNRRSPVYGILAVGNWMRVYKYDDNRRIVVDWAPPGIQAGRIFNISQASDRPYVQRILDYIRDHH